MSTNMHITQLIGSVLKCGVEVFLVEIEATL